MCHNNRPRKRIIKKLSVGTVQTQLDGVELLYLRRHAQELLVLHMKDLLQRLTESTKEQERYYNLFKTTTDSSERIAADDKYKKTVRIIHDLFGASQLTENYHKKLFDLVTNKNIPEVVEVPKWELFTNLAKICKISARFRPLIIHIYEKDDDTCSQLSNQLSTLAAREDNNGVQFLKILSTGGNTTDATDVPALMAFKDGMCFATLLKPYSAIQQFFDRIGVHHE
ncbi:hypothetical protein Fcan01_16277 [Folsomia candida]|uniref:Uncharacterized protein n=1 Tax=Folsomia candida TaxID=158441 RepID=A0A226DWD3_FOLCA|nr:hypothetical protein Fcan01_16277 [Folsomia candida]